jgi:hypothetical protein
MCRVGGFVRKFHTIDTSLSFFIEDTQSRQSAKLFLQFSELGFPHPLTRKRVCPPLWFRGEGGTLACGRGVGESQIRRGTDTVVLYIYVLCDRRYIIIFIFKLFRVRAKGVRL